jgi:uncharacterized MAPEG superfamily protein
MVIRRRAIAVANTCNAIHRIRRIMSRKSVIREGKVTMSSSIGGSAEMQILFCAILLGIIQLFLAVLTGVRSAGLAWAAGPRDETRAHPGKIAGRLERAFENFLETFPFFAAGVLLVHALDKSTHTSVLGAQMYIWARVLYVPAYVIAIPFVRTLIWTASLVGILMVLAAAWPGV